MPQRRRTAIFNDGAAGVLLVFVPGRVEEDARHAPHGRGHRCLPLRVAQLVLQHFVCRAPGSPGHDVTARARCGCSMAYLRRVGARFGHGAQRRAQRKMLQAGSSWQVRVARTPSSSDKWKMLKHSATSLRDEFVYIYFQIELELCKYDAARQIAVSRHRPDHVRKLNGREAGANAGTSLSQIFHFQHTK